MYEDSLGNQIPFSGSRQDFAQAMLSGIKSPVKNTENKSELDVIRKSLTDTTARLQEVQKIIGKLTQENKKSLQENSALFRKVVSKLDASMKEKQASKKTSSEKDFNKFVKKGMRPGSIYTNDVRANKHLFHIKQILSGISKKMGAIAVKHRHSKMSEASIDKEARKIERGRGTKSGRNPSLSSLGDYGFSEYFKEVLNPETLAQNALTSIGGFLGKGLTALGGIDAVKPMADAVDEGVKFQKITSETLLQQKGMSKIFGSQEKIREEVLKSYKDEYQTGLDISVSLKNRVKIARMGVTQQDMALKLATKAGRLAYLTDMDAESTAELFGEWHNKLGMSANDTSRMAMAMRDTQKLTGLMGENLTKAISASRSVMEYMRSIGNFSSNAAENVLKFSAAAEKYGVGEQAGELQKLIAGGPAMVHGSKMSPALYRALGSSGLTGRFNAGENLNNDSTAMKRLIGGFEGILKQMEGMGPNQQKAFGEMLGIQKGDLERLIKAQKEANLSFGDRIKSAEDELKKGGMSKNERKQTQANISELKVAQAIKEGGNIGNAAVELNKLMEEVNTFAGLDKNANKINTNELLKLGPEKQKEVLMEANEIYEMQKKMNQTPQEQAVQELIKIRKLISEGGATAGMAVNKWTALGLGIGGGLLGTIGGELGKIGLSKAFKWFKGGSMPKTPGVGPSGLPGWPPGGGASAAGKGLPGWGGKAVSGFSKTLKFLGPLAALAGGGISGYTGAEEAGVGKTAGTIRGLLTGGAGRGSIASSTFGIQKDSTADWEMGMAGAALHGAAVGSFAGPIGAGIGAAGAAIVEAGKITYDTVQEIKGIRNNITKDTENRMSVEKSIAEREKDLIDSIQNPENKLNELQERKKIVEQQISGAGSANKSLQKGLDNSWFWERWGSSDDKLIEENKSKIALKEQELNELNNQINELQTAKTPSVEKMKSDRANKEKTEIVADSNQNLSDVASNTADTNALLGDVRSILNSIAAALAAGAAADTTPNTTGAAAPDYGRMVKNARPGNVNRNMTYTQVS